MPDLIDLMENAPEPQKEVGRPGWRLIPRYPTLCFDPHDNARVRLALEQKDWRALRRLRVSWYDEYAHQWFRFGPHFFEHLEYLEVWDGADVGEGP